MEVLSHLDPFLHSNASPGPSKKPNKIIWVSLGARNPWQFCGSRSDSSRAAWTVFQRSSAQKVTSLQTLTGSPSAKLPVVPLAFPPFWQVEVAPPAMPFCDAMNHSS